MRQPQATLGLLAAGRRKERRSIIGQQVDIGLDGLGRALAQRQDAQRNPGVVGGDGQVDGVPSPIAWPRSAAASASKEAAMKIGERLA